VLSNRYRDLLSRPSTQSFFLQILKLCHAALNYGGGQSVDHSGELNVLRCVRDASWLSTPAVIFDVGANDGEYARAASQILGDVAQIWAFEPQSACFQALQSEFAKSERIRTRKLALGKELGTGKLHFDSSGETTASLAEATSSNGQTEEVQVTTLDEICRQEHIERIDLLKIDTEGFEMDVLLGASDMLNAGRISSLQFEFGHTFLATPYHFHDIWNLLTARYRIYRVLRRGMVEVTSYTHDLEIYKIANFFCIHRSLPR
jgi:FkbM family methyltransferase